MVYLRPRSLWMTEDAVPSRGKSQENRARLVTKSAQMKWLWEQRLCEIRDLAPLPGSIRLRFRRRHFAFKEEAGFLSEEEKSLGILTKNIWMEGWGSVRRLLYNFYPEERKLKRLPLEPRRVLPLLSWTWLCWWQHCLHQS